MMQIIAITTLLLGAALLLVGRRLARRRGLSEAAGLGLSLCVIALGLALVPNDWQMRLTGGEAGDRWLTLAREAGVTGLAFLAGTRFNAPEVWKTRRISFFVAGAGALLLVTLVILLTSVSGQTRGAAITAAAAIAGTSLWLPGQLGLASRKGAIAAASARGAAAVLTVMAILLMHYSAIFHELAGRPLTKSADTIVALYELVKIAVFFSLAYFVATRFLARAAGRVSSARTLIGYLLIAALVFVLAISVIGPLAGFAWAFVAAAVLSHSEVGSRLGKTDQPVVVAVLLSFAFLPLLLQSHGRSLTDKTLVFSAVIAALAYKYAAAWAGAQAAGIAGAEARRVAAATLASGEAAILFLGFGVTRWSIDSPFYFGILAYALISMLLGPILWRFTFGEAADFERSSVSFRQPNAPRRRKSGFRKQVMMPVAVIAGSLLMFGSSARAQSQNTASGDDPVARVMERVQKVVDERAAAAGRVLAAERLINESAEAKKQGKPDQAKEALEKAEQIVAEAGASPHSFWTDELMRRVTGERAAFNPEPPTPTFQPLPIAPFGKAIPRLVLARYSQYRETLGRILVEEKVPAELLAVALVESGFNPLALSPKGARGIWQFMPATAARYGLQVQPANDHRTHPEHSTRAAARYLRDLYQQFGDWKLALAAYNAGEARVQQIIDRTGIRDFDELARRGLLPMETRNYVPAVLAAWAQMSGVNGGHK